MDHKPAFGHAFTCPECGQEWVLAGVGPGNYYEKREEQEAQAQRLDDELLALGINLSDYES